MLVFGEFIQSESLPNVSRVLTFKLGADDQLPDIDWKPRVVFNPPILDASESTLREGFATYQDVCMGCHGLNAVSGLLIPDLRGSAYLWDADSWNEVVIGGSLEDRGMASFADNISLEQSNAIRAYVTQQAHRGKSLFGRVSAVAKASGATVLINLMRRTASTTKSGQLHQQRLCRRDCGMPALTFVFSGKTVASRELTRHNGGNQG